MWFLQKRKGATVDAPQGFSYSRFVSGDRLPTMVLSETRGLQLSSVMRGGIGSAWRLGAAAHKSPNFRSPDLDQ
jgi:hypothetical protein